MFYCVYLTRFLFGILATFLSFFSFHTYDMIRFIQFFFLLGNVHSMLFNMKSETKRRNEEREGRLNKFVMVVVFAHFFIFFSSLN